MPIMKRIEPSKIQAVSRGRGNAEEASQLFNDASEQLNAAIDSGEAIEITLEENERPAGIKRVFEDAAEKIGGGYKVRFATAVDGTRPHKVRSGKMTEEVFHFYVKIVGTNNNNAEEHSNGNGTGKGKGRSAK